MRYLFIVAFLVSGFFAHAQKEGGFGLKGGLNYGSTGDIKSDGQAIIDNPESDLGFHAGVYVKIDLEGLYVRPELVYTNLKTGYGSSGNLEVQKLDLPVLFGFNLVGPLHVFAGPSAQYILDTDLGDIELARVQEEFTVGIQAGVGLNLGNVGVDIRYEAGLSENQASYVSSLSNERIDTRPEQLIVALSFKL